MKSQKKYKNITAYYSPSFALCQASSLTNLKQLIKNNIYLLKQIKKTFVCQQAEFKTKYSIRLSENTIKDIRSGRIKSMQLTWLNFFSLYWSIPLYELIGYDFETRDKLKSLSNNDNDSLSSSLSSW